MYYEEKVEGGITYSRSTPTGSWMPLSNIELTNKISRLQVKLKDMELQLEICQQQDN